MYELEYVKKRKRRKVAVITGGVSTIVVTSLSIIAFLGRFTGTFTVSLDTANVQLTLSEKSTFLTQTSFLRIDNLAPFSEYTYEWFDEYTDDQIDNDLSNYSLGYVYKGESNTVQFVKFFKYTFYIKNIGNVNASYDFTLKVLELKASSDGRKLDDTLRVMIYDNPLESHESRKIYGKAGKGRIGPDGISVDYRPPISISEETANIRGNEFPGYVDKTFINSEVIAQYKKVDLRVGEIKRYTLVTWLEGELSNSQTESEETAPKGASIKLGVEINAYEN